MASLPSLVAYLGRLPGGIASSPGALVKGSVVRASLEPAYLSAEWPLELGVPACVADLVLTPPDMRAWVPEAHYGALLAAIYDRWFPDDLPRFEAAMLEKARALLSGSRYRSLFVGASKTNPFERATERWSAFHRGSSLSVTASGSGTVTLRLDSLDSPPQLFAFGEMPRVDVVAGLVAAAEACLETPIRIERKEATAELATYALSW
jgi:hypothetical protein